jgi:hypothetical protein
VAETSSYKVVYGDRADNQEQIIWFPKAVKYQASNKEKHISVFGRKYII